MKGIRKILFGSFGLLFLCVLAINLYIHAETKPYIYEHVPNAPVVQTALVLGAVVSEDGSLSPIFTDRADMAISLYKAGKVSKILVSGDNSTVEYNEVSPVRVYLIGRGIPDEDIFLDYAGFDTYSSMYRARDIFSVSTVLITTQSFHLPRSVFIARHLGIDAYGVNADVGHMLFRNYIREIIANEKAILNLLVNRQPKFLGDQIPIDSDFSSVEEIIPTTESEEKERSDETSIEPFDSGVYGAVLRGPICPVMQNPPLPECVDQPFETTVEVRKKIDREEMLFAEVKTNADGKYLFHLPPGNYVLEAVSGNPFPLCQIQPITVEPKVLTKVRLTCDTGIR